MAGFADLGPGRRPAGDANRTRVALGRTLVRRVALVASHAAGTSGRRRRMRALHAELGELRLDVGLRRTPDAVAGEAQLLRRLVSRQERPLRLVRNVA